jgi:hypothetical protein
MQYIIDNTLLFDIIVNVSMIFFNFLWGVIMQKSKTIILMESIYNPTIKNGRLYFKLQNKKCSLSLKSIVGIDSKRDDCISIWVKPDSFYAFRDHYQLDLSDKISYDDGERLPKMMCDWQILNIKGDQLFYSNPFDLKVGSIYDKKCDGGFAYSITEYKITHVSELGVFGIKTGNGSFADHSPESLR